ncbi:vitamin K epoxide reductase family protein [Candidatus Peregrinibacteria bacterium]|nr:vitamin K epoxide reductase family protein [Candidatus Peregrinibacteria bacterium]
MKEQKWILIGFFILGFIGFIDTSYLTVSHYSGSELSCTLTEGCGEVTSSEYSSIFGVPLALLGLLYYLTIVVLTKLYWDLKKHAILNMIRLLTLSGFMFSLYLVYLQIYVIEAICQYCMLSAISSTLLFTLSLISLKYKKI